MFLSSSVPSCSASCKNGYPLSVHRSPRIIGSSFQSEYLFFVLGQSTTRRIRGKRNEARGKKIKISSLFRPLASDLRLFPTQGRVHDLGRRSKDGSSQRTAFSNKADLFAREAELASPEARLAARTATGLRQQTGFPLSSRELSEPLNTLFLDCLCLPQKVTNLSSLSR